MGLWFCLVLLRPTLKVKKEQRCRQRWPLDRGCFVFSFTEGITPGKRHLNSPFPRGGWRPHTESIILPSLLSDLNGLLIPITEKQLLKKCHAWSQTQNFKFQVLQWDLSLDGIWIQPHRVLICSQEWMRSTESYLHSSPLSSLHGERPWANVSFCF